MSSALSMLTGHRADQAVPGHCSCQATETFVTPPPPTFPPAPPGNGCLQYEHVDQATRAMEKTNGRDFMGRAITVEYTQNADPNSRQVPSRRSR